MNKKSLAVTVSLLLIIIIVCVIFLFGKYLNKPESSVQSQEPTPPPVSVEENEPDNTQDNEPDDTQDNQPDKTHDNRPDDTQNNEPDEEPDTVEPAVNTVKPSSYTEFSLLSGMTAKQAYEHLNEFLNSDYAILTNKQNKVSSDFVPKNLVTVSGSDYKMESTAAAALSEMLNAAKNDGMTDLVLYSGYRTYASQKNKYETRINKYKNEGLSQEEAEKKAGEYIAPPGSSEHNTGLAADVSSSKIVSKYGYLSDDFDTTAEWRWLNGHCAEYGFILRYRKDAVDITGFSYEPWHFRYIGKEHATACTAMGITYEEYYEMLTDFRDKAKADAGV